MVEYLIVQEGVGYIVDGVTVSLTNPAPRHNAGFTSYEFASREQWLEGKFE